MTETLRNIYSDGRMLNPKSMEIEAKFTTTADDLNNFFQWWWNTLCPFLGLCDTNPILQLRGHM
jgi:hypothetical protein